MTTNRQTRRTVHLAALLGAGIAALALAGPVAAQSGRATVGKLRIGDESGQTIWEQPAPVGEKLFKAPAGTKQFRVYFDYDGSVTKKATIKVIGPQGVFAGIQEKELDTPGTYSVDFAFEEPLADNEYLVNAYVDVDGKESLSDGMTLLVGEAAIIPPDIEQNRPADASATGAADAASVSAPAAPQPASPVGAPSRLLLLGSGLGVIVLLAIVVWAGRSALKQR